MEQDKDPNVDALMAELKAIMDNEAQDMKGMAQQEAEHIFTQIVKEFSKDSDITDKESVLAVVSMVDDREKMNVSFIASSCISLVKNKGDALNRYSLNHYRGLHQHHSKKLIINRK